MAYTTPYYTSNDIVSAIQRKIMFPLSQSTFTYNDVLSFVNEEMFINQVPAVLDFHEEYFVFRAQVPLQTDISRYPLPSRAIGMRLRDLMWADQNNNFFDMTRINADDKAFFQRNIGANQAIHKFYVEGNDVCLTPAVTNQPTGSLLMTYFLRPNQLVNNARAATITNFVTTVTINSNYLNNLDSLSINSIPFTAVTSLGGTINNISAGSVSTITTVLPHNLATGQTVVITGSNSSPNVDGTWLVTVIDTFHFQINAQTLANGSVGSFTCSNQFLIVPGNDIQTCNNLIMALNSVKNIPNIAPNSLLPPFGFPNQQVGGNNTSFLPGSPPQNPFITVSAPFFSFSTVEISASTSPIATNTIYLFYNNINTVFVTNNTIAFKIPNNLVGFQFDQLPSTFTDPVTNMTTPLYTVGSTVDFLQTNFGHKTFAIDAEIQQIFGNVAFFDTGDLLTFTDTSSFYILIQCLIGDYICLSNECIIPQIPSELHTGLADRASARILAAIGDRDGLAVVNQKIQEISGKEGQLIDNRVEGAPQKVTNRYSLLRMGAMGVRRRI